MMRAEPKGGLDHEMPDIYTVADLMRRTGLSRAAVVRRVQNLRAAGAEATMGTFTRVGTTYLFSRRQAEAICLGPGRGSDSHKYWQKVREANRRQRPKIA